MEERKPEPLGLVTLSEQQFLRCVCDDTRNGRNFLATSTASLDEGAFEGFYRQTGLDFNWPVDNMQERRMLLNEALRRRRMRCDWNRDSARFILMIVERADETRGHD